MITAPEAFQELFTVALSTSTRNNASARERSCPFAIFHHPACTLHKIEGHPEQPGRVDAILLRLRKYYKEHYFRLAPDVTDEQILLFHSPQHLSKLKKCFLESSEKSAAVSIDSDTIVMPKSRDAIYRAAGSVVAAVDSLFLPSGDPQKTM